MNRWYEIKIIVSGDNIKCYLDGALIHNIVDAGATGPTGLAASCVKDTATGDVILKLVNVTGEKIQGKINLAGVGRPEPVAKKTVLAGDPKTEDTFANPRAVLPVVMECPVGKSFTNELPAWSLTVIRMKAGFSK